MERTYLIPANAKKSMLMFGVFNTADLIIFGSGLVVTFLMMMLLPVNEFSIAVISLMPALICGFLVFPIPNYHNVRTVIKNAWIFYTTRQKYIWKGWCLNHGETNKE